MYGTQELNGLAQDHGMSGGDYHKQFHGARTVAWTTKGLRVTRLRLLSDPGYRAWDVSYCHGFIGDEPVVVEVPFDQLPKQGFRRAIVEHAIRDNINAKWIGVFSAISTLN